MTSTQAVSSSFMDRTVQQALRCASLGVALWLTAVFAPRAEAQCTGTWVLRTSLTPPPSPRAGAMMVYDSVRGVTVLFGGSIAGGADNETWEWDGASWIQKFPFTSPSQRFGHVMAYDSARQVTVLFGGYNGTLLSDETWEWNGSNWRRRSPAHSPPLSALGAMAYDSARGVCVLFGGITFVGGPTGAALLGETWEWNGTDWTVRPSDDAPASIAGQAMCYDSARGFSVQFGGTDTIAFSDDTWLWNGANWLLQLPAPAPTGRYYHAMAFDNLRNVSVLFGGTDNTVTNNETWEWDGATWQLRVPVVFPTPRSSSGAAFDTARGVTVLFGGDDGALQNDTWEWVGPGPFLTQQPANQSLAIGQSAAFTVTAGGPAPLTFLWRKNGAALSNGGSISGATTATLTVNPVASGDAGSYDVVVSNLCGQVISRIAILSACNVSDPAEDCNGNGTLDSCDIAADPALDTNGNGVLDSCEIPGGQILPAAPCGLCGGGTATMLPMALWFMGASRKRYRRTGKPR